MFVCTVVHPNGVMSSGCGYPQSSAAAVVFCDYVTVHTHINCVALAHLGSMQSSVASIQDTLIQHHNLSECSPKHSAL